MTNKITDLILWQVKYLMALAGYRGLDQDTEALYIQVLAAYTIFVLVMDCFILLYLYLWLAN